ncbi:hypothetical protein CBR_g31649 [Chara braunii]|uniref:Uncharacterized protein n=1 Tax=Chara braunii TaxID=69332 RepID=A0A388LFX6_CHABU|nr:hypothetical protein CBR_g31649 [Chara braunii]|eukprot:GBG81092.1 hypothetical protein CBR_g31649 [Chara braunii]
MYRRENNIPNNGPIAPTEQEKGEDADMLEDFMLPLTALGREEHETPQDDNEVDEVIVVRASAQKAATQVKNGKLKQQSIKRWTENNSQRRLDVAGVEYLCEHGAPFNYEVAQSAKMIVKVIKNHHHTVSLYNKCSDLVREMSPILPTEVRFTFKFMMLERLRDRRKRNTLSSGTVAKLVYVHWNGQLQKVKGTKREGYIDLWANYFDEAEAPSLDDPTVLPATAASVYPSDDEGAWMICLRKAPKWRVPRMKRVDNSSSSDSSDDGEDLIWRGKGQKTQEQQQLEDLKEMQLLDDDVEGGYEEGGEADGEEDEEGEEEEGED